jgi:hypothetical protein
MTTRPWVEEGANRFERHLLGSARNDGPSPEARRAARRALGIGALAATEVIGAAGVSTLHAKLASGVFAKWIVLGGLGGAAIVGSLEYARGHSFGAQPVAVAAPERAAPAARANAPVAPMVRRERAAEPAATAAAAPAPISAKLTPTAAPVLAPATPSEPGPTLADETAALDAVRVAAQSSGAAALGLLDAYDRKFSSGSLRAEAAVLRVEALLAAGRRADAVALATRQISADPQGAHAARLRSLVEADTP